MACTMPGPALVQACSNGMYLSAFMIQKKFATEFVGKKHNSDGILQ
uniref:Uncharacterized protein n=1 Tax=Arundo donax TaxID=35708 RepID=A0A0A9BU67_ARUDO